MQVVSLLLRRGHAVGDVVKLALNALLGRRKGKVGWGLEGGQGKRERQAGHEEDTPEADPKRAKSNGQAVSAGRPVSADSQSRNVQVGPTRPAICLPVGR